MGSLRSVLPGLMLLLPAPAWAQSNGSAPVFSLPPGPARPTGPEREGPEIDVPRDTAPPATQPAPATPPPVAPTVTPARPAAAPPRQPATPSAQERRQPAPIIREPAEARPPSAPEAAPPPAATPEPAARPAPAPPPPPPPQTAPAPAPAPVEPSEQSGTPWLLAGFAALIAILAGFVVLRRPRRDRFDQRPQAPEALPKAPPPPRKPAPPAAATPRPRLALTLEIRAARLSLIGVTVSYALFVENKGDAPAEDILIRGLLLAAGETQQTALGQFLARDAGDALHSIATLAPGATSALSGDLRIGSQALATVQIGTRAALVPLAAFDADYRWEGGAGRTARAFIVGQEQQPPTDRLLPLRLDQGPRQFRDAGCRATALEMTR